MSEDKTSIGKSKVLKGIAWATLASTFWGISGVVLQFVSQNAAIPASWFLSVRTIFSGILLLVIGSIMYGTKIFHVFKDWKSIICIVAYGIIGLGANLMSFYLSVQDGNAASATILQYLSPLFILLGGFLFMHKRPYKIDLIVFLLALVGVFLAITKGDINQLAIPLPALLWGIVSGITAACYVVIPRPLMEENSPIVVLGWGTLIAGLVFNIHQPVWVGVPHLTTGAIVGIGAIVIIGTVIPFACLLHSLHFASSEDVSLVDAVQPVVTFILSVLFLHTKISLMEVVGSVLVILAIYILQDSKRRNVKQQKL
ncbi:DMT family transporter [Fructilactobacillus fructivorans]|uniref:Transport protein n=1 Tax=Fructilactobacillus fructivorans TaxID=1614 RepID=A0A0C1PQT5_9LACO|nr:DMT family transporter [Fructilactobacillus fructivorans]KID42226.1 transport protein [Fructilactobacillus fructivorans]MCT0151148.1 EamA family transporter [Fructilactobacillus fructivorans]MCT2867294.1 EamA family transporter [Fructilactobacillus fructivorans]MCT2869186.1 EamA family transporter [Fructilactobacillus fructivorans]MCT2873093.1 EamA family transporter [Fructilactobacillus fructivorans]